MLIMLARPRDAMIGLAVDAEMPARTIGCNERQGWSAGDADH